MTPVGSGRGGAAREGQHLRVPVPPDPSAWQSEERDRIGVWSWLPAGGSWFVVDRLGSRAVAVPRLRNWDDPDVLDHAALTLRTSARRRIATAYALDVGGDTVMDIVDRERARRAPTPRAEKRQGPEVSDRVAETGRASLKSIVNRDRREGRKALASIGALPWVLWPDGKLPAKWWGTETFSIGIGAWHWVERAYRIARVAGEGYGYATMVGLDRDRAWSRAIVAVLSSRELPDADRVWAERCVRRAMSASTG